MYQAAKAIQEWLPSEGGAPWDPQGEQRTRPALPNLDKFWGLIGGENGLTANCGEYATLHELMLEQLGIRATKEHIVATEPEKSQAGKARYGTVLKKVQMIRLPVPGDYRVFLDFGYPNYGEGAVRVGSRVYTEGAGATVVGEDSASRDAELDALLKLADQFPGGRARFQRVAQVRSDGAKLWGAPPGFDEYVPLPSSP
jgi:hypothetical protein